MSDSLRRREFVILPEFDQPVTVPTRVLEECFHLHADEQRGVDGVDAIYASVLRRQGELLATILGPKGRNPKSER